jgi:uncharacterized membrane protein
MAFIQSWQRPAHPLHRSSVGRKVKQMKQQFFSFVVVLMVWLAACCSSGQSLGSNQSMARQRPIRVLTISGDWRSQTWYQEVRANDGKKYRGHFIAHEANKAAPGRFQFTDITNYTAQQYGDANFFRSFDVILIGDIVGWSLPPRFLTGLRDWVRDGGGLAYMASYKWHTALLDETPLEEALPARFGINGSSGDWKSYEYRLAEKKFTPVAVLPDHPLARGLDWGSLQLGEVARITPKHGSAVVLKSLGGAPLLVAGSFGKGRSVISASIWANDQFSPRMGDWKGAGTFYTQLISWLGQNAPQRNIALQDVEGAVTVKADATKTLNAVSAKLFSIHAAHDDPGLTPFNEEARNNFDALNLKGGFSRMGHIMEVEKQNDNDDPNSFNWAAFDFSNLDKQLAVIKTMQLEPIVLFEMNYGRPQWLWEDMKSSWDNATPQSAAEMAEMVAAVVEYANRGKGGDPNYKLNVRYIELGNEPDFNLKTIPGYARLLKTVAARIHRDYPGVQIGTFGSYEVPYLKPFLEAVNPDLDWISRHPYGWTGEMLFKAQDDIVAFQKAKGLREIPFIITEWDFWIQGREKFDYMMRRNFEAVRRPELLGTLHYRLGQYAEPVYLFGVLWTGSGPGAGAKGTPMHDAYDAFWLFRAFRGHRVQAEVTSAVAGLDAHLHATAARDGDSVNTVLYYDWGSGRGHADTVTNRRYPRVKTTLRMTVPPVNRARTMTISRATGEGFEIVGTPTAVKAGATSVETELTVDSMTGYSITLR